MSLKVMRTPRSLDLEITSRCNAACRYCYYLNNPGIDYSDLPTGDWLALFQELADCQVMDVTLQGGEPLLRTDFLPLVDGIVAHRMRFSLLTNGRLMTAPIAEHLRATGRCNQVQVSLDGSQPDIHESMRGPGSFFPALNAIRLLRDVGLPVTVRVTVHPGNLDDLAAITELLLVDLGLPSYSTNAATSLGSSGKYAADVLLSPLQRLKAMRVLAELDAAYPGRIQANAGPLADWHMFHAMEEARRNGAPISGRGRLVGCGCVFDRLAVRSDGAYIPCVMLPQMVMGYMGKVTLRQVWQEAEALVGLRQRNSIPLDSFSECHACLWQMSCTGSCPGSAITLSGSANVPCPGSCLQRFQDSLAKEGESLWR